jgi:uncharacterized protein
MAGMSDLSIKLGKLEDALLSYESVLVAYSGGVDSSLLTAIAHDVLGPRALAVTAVSPSLARRELDDAKTLAQRHGWNHEVIGTHEVSREEYARNDLDRCFWCKSELFDVLEPIAAGRKICLGTNTDDLGEHRPGLRAATERAVASPMVQADLSKADVRAAARTMGLPTADKPAAPCLASRFAYGVRVTAAGLRRVEAAEDLVRGFGFDVVRVRDMGDGARVEVPRERLNEARGHFPAMAAGLDELGFERVVLDPEGFRSGSLNPPHPEF